MRNKSLYKVAVLLLTLILLGSSLCFSGCALIRGGTTPILMNDAIEIAAALERDFAAEAEKMYAEANAYEASGEILNDVYGNPVDMTAYIADLREGAALLPNLSCEAYTLAIMNDIYRREYVGEYRSFVSLSSEIVSILRHSFYIDKLTDPTDATEALIYCYSAAVGDRYASFVNQETASDTSNQGENYVGIGITVVRLPSGYMQVVSVAEGSPARKAGFLPDDIIVAVEGEDVLELGYDEAISRVRGKIGTSVTLTVQRESGLLDLTAVRAQLKTQTVFHKILTAGDGKIGYVYISEFEETTYTQFVAAVEALEAAGVSKLVFDLRNNGGGRLETVLGMLEYVTPDDRNLPLIRMQYKDQTVEYFTVEEYLKAAGGTEEYFERYKSAKGHAVDLPIAVLCNQYTASAGELFTSGLKDFGVAEIFGTLTYGKGMGQSAFIVSDLYAYLEQEGFPGYTVKQDAFFRVSTFYYAPPVSENYEGKGVEPHHTVTLPEELMLKSVQQLTEEEDTQLAAATAFLLSGAPLSPAPTPPPAGNGGQGDQAPEGNGGSSDVGPGESDPDASPNVDSDSEKEQKDATVYYVIGGILIVLALAFTLPLVLSAIKARKKEQDPFFTSTDKKP